MSKKRPPIPAQGYPFPLEFTIPGRVVTKKNHRRLAVIGGQARMLPAQAWEEWADQAGEFARIGASGRAQWGVRVIPRRPGRKRGMPVPRKPMLIPGFVPCLTAGNVHVTAHYYPPDRKWMPDLLGMEEALADALERFQVVSNDRQIVSWDGSRIMGVDQSGVGRLLVLVRELA